MAYFPAKTLVLMQLSMLLLMTTSVLSHKHLPIPVPPATAPAPEPVMPPPRVFPPVFKRKFVAAQGFVSCSMSCKYRGIDTFLGNKPLPGAVVSLVCLNRRYRPVEVAKDTTDRRGYFLMKTEKVTDADYRKCKVVLAKSPSVTCNVPANTNSRSKSAMLFPSKNPHKLGPKYALYDVGTFAYKPSKIIKCRH